MLPFLRNKILLLQSSYTFESFFIKKFYLSIWFLNKTFWGTQWLLNTLSVIKIKVQMRMSAAMKVDETSTVEDFFLRKYQKNTLSKKKSSTTTTEFRLMMTTPNTVDNDQLIQMNNNFKCYNNYHIFPLYVVTFLL